MASSRDFLGAFGAAGAPRDDAAAGGSDDIELSLGLSLGGRFGTEAKHQRLERSSSIASVCSASSLDGDRDADPSPAALLLRTSSLPTETEEERWRRREMQNRRRLEARRKRVERRNSKGSTSSSSPVKDAANGFQLRTSTGSQGSTSVSTTVQGIETRVTLSPTLLC
jgi:hypothetical protein